MSDVPRHERLVLLNELISRSVNFAAVDTKPPVHQGEDLLRQLMKRVSTGDCIEFVKADDSDNEEERKEHGIGKTSYCAKLSSETRSDDFIYIAFLIEKVDHTVSDFPVVNMRTRRGKKIVGDEHDRGSLTSHIVVRLPLPHHVDDGKYRIAIEYSRGINRADIERLINRQLRRYSKEEDLRYPVKRKKKKEDMLRYRPRFDLVAEFGHKLDLRLRPQEITQLVFTKREIKENTGAEIEARLSSFVASVEIRVTGEQGPTDPAEKLGWWEGIRQKYKADGFTPKVYFRTVGGNEASASLNDEMIGATDLLLSPKEVILVDGDVPVRWRDEIDRATVARMAALLDNDTLWDPGQHT